MCGFAVMGFTAIPQLAISQRKPTWHQPTNNQQPTNNNQKTKKPRQDGTTASRQHSQSWSI
jgi:hypothetical protein